MSTQYRIITNGEKYRIQERTFFFFWADCWSIPVEHNSIEAAQRNIELHRELTKTKAKRSRWKPVNVELPK